MGMRKTRAAKAAGSARRLRRRAKKHVEVDAIITDIMLAVFARGQVPRDLKKLKVLMRELHQEHNITVEIDIIGLSDALIIKRGEETLAVIVLACGDGARKLGVEPVLTADFLKLTETSLRRPLRYKDRNIRYHGVFFERPFDSDYQHELLGTLRLGRSFPVGQKRGRFEIHDHEELRRKVRNDPLTVVSIKVDVVTIRGIKFLRVKVHTEHQYPNKYAALDKIFYSVEVFWIRL
jgi:hypothetical protein